jgi:hypothetical protein
MGADAAAGYSNHNTTYHAWLVDLAAKHRDDVVDAACTTATCFGGPAR